MDRLKPKRWAHIGGLRGVLSGCGAGDYKPVRRLSFFLFHNEVFCSPLSFFTYDCHFRGGSGYTLYTADERDLDLLRKGSPRSPRRGEEVESKVVHHFGTGFMQTLMFRVNENQDWHGVILAC
jgi:hypothetical protein